MRTDGSELTRITHDARNDQVSKWSRDGKGILLCSDKTGKNQIYSMWSNGMAWRGITTDAWDDYTASWSRDGKQVLFPGDQGEGSNIHSLDLKTKRMTRLTSNALGLGCPMPVARRAKHRLYVHTRNRKLHVHHERGRLLSAEAEPIGESRAVFGKSFARGSSERIGEICAQRPACTSKILTFPVSGPTIHRA